MHWAQRAAHCSRAIPRSDKCTNVQTFEPASQRASLAAYRSLPSTLRDPGGCDLHLVLQGTRMLRALACSTAAPAILALAWPFRPAAKCPPDGPTHACVCPPLALGYSGPTLTQTDRTLRTDREQRSPSIPHAAATGRAGRAGPECRALAGPDLRSSYTVWRAAGSQLKQLLKQSQNATRQEHVVSRI